MRRESRKHGDKENTKNMLYLGGSILGIGIIAFVLTFVIYGNKMDKQNSTNSGRIAELIQDTETKSASTGMGKTVEESKNETRQYSRRY